MKSTSITDKVFSRLKRGSMTPIDIINMGVLNPYDCIRRIRKRGYEIEMKEKQKGKMCRYYYRGSYAQ